MRRITMLLAAMLIGIMATTAACVSDHDRLVDFDKLPAKAKSFIKQNFANEKIAHILYDSELTDRDYKVRFENGTEVEFNNDGKWTKVDCQRSAVPAAIVPTEIASYVKRNFADKQIVEISCDWNEWEVQLSNGLELQFNSKFKLREIDD